ncbi:hypothetical protein Droror1_Dr00004546 [Drosera rotundifolia]
MGSLRIICFAFGLIALLAQVDADNAANVTVNAAPTSGRVMPDSLFGVFFEEINRAGDGGLWAELVQNRGFEAGGRHAPSWIVPWGRVGDDESVFIATELNSPFQHNKVALRIDALCDRDCPFGGVGVFNPGNGGMNIVKGKKYNIEFHAKASRKVDLTVAFVSSDGTKVLATHSISIHGSKWNKYKLHLKALDSDVKGMLYLTMTKKATIWLDQVSAMPQDTYKGHGYRIDLFEKILALKPQFLRFPGGCYVEGELMSNAFRWKETVGPWEERPGHYNDPWSYWSDDALGYLEYLQLAEDLRAKPVWVINSGNSVDQGVDTTLIAPFVQEMLDSIEFARGNTNSTWGSLRAKMGHPESFDLKYIAVGNEDCGHANYNGNYLKFYNAIKQYYPDIQVINNCDFSGYRPGPDQPADLYDFHTYQVPKVMFAQNHQFDNAPRSGPKVFVSEYAVTDPLVNKNGTVIGAVSEAAFLVGVERNSDVVEMASYAPLFGYLNQLQWRPNAIFFNASESYGIPSYWMQTFFIDSNGATLLDTNVATGANIVASAIRYVNKDDNQNYIKIKVVNFQDVSANISITLNGVNPYTISGKRKTVLTGNPYDSNSLDNPTKIIPQVLSFDAPGTPMTVKLDPYSLTSFDYLDHSASRPGGRKVNLSKKNLHL